MPTRSIRYDEIKPSPCVGCGYCCLTATCAVALSLEAISEVPNRRGPICRFLYLKDGIFRCHMASQYFTELAIGEGCCSNLNSQRRRFIQYLRMKFP